MFSTPLICSSIGVTTVEATTSALAPGYCPVMLMIGGGDLRIWGDRQARERHAAQDHEDDRRPPAAKIGPIDEEMRDAHFYGIQPALGLAAALAGARGICSAPPASLWRLAGRASGPFTITRSVAASRSAERPASRRRAGRASRISAAPCRRRRHGHIFAACSEPTAASRDQQRQMRRRAGHADAAEHARTKKYAVSELVNIAGRGWCPTTC